EADWRDSQRQALGMLLHDHQARASEGSAAPPTGETWLLCVNGGTNAETAAVPSRPIAGRWIVRVDTSQSFSTPSPLPGHEWSVPPYSLALLEFQATS
ncbi:MAG: hypothetical protein HW416_3804, partial [Chloroflexi bacterium]|nr:hypothetical protein [Chloroflexota bacterium]